LGGLVGGGGGGTNYVVPATYSQGGNPAPYVPTGQLGQDVNAQNLLGQMYGWGTGNLSQWLPQINQAGSSGVNAANYVQGAYSPQLLDAGMLNALGIGGLAPQLTGLASQWLNPPGTSPLYQQLEGQTMQGASAANAAAGVEGPYAASTTDQALNNLRLGWLAQQPSMVSGLTSAASGAAGQELSLAGAAEQNYFGTQGGAALSALNNMFGATGNAFGIPQQTLADIMPYLQLGQNASNLAAGAGATGFRQNQTQLGDIGALTGSVLGGGVLGNTLFGGPLNFGGGGLFGGLFNGGGNVLSSVPAFSGGDAALASDLFGP